MFAKLIYISSLNEFKSLIIVFVFFVSCGGPSVKSAYASGDVEIKLYMASLNTLPTYCQYRMAETTFRKEFPILNGQRSWPPHFGKMRNQWENDIGNKNWRHLHHYCFGIRAFTEYSNMSPEEKKINKEPKLQRALREFEYMRKAQTLNFPFWYDLYRYETYIHLQLGNTAKAQWALEQSLKYKKQ